MGLHTPHSGLGECRTSFLPLESANVGSQLRGNATRAAQPQREPCGPLPVPLGSTESGWVPRVLRPIGPPLLNAAHSAAPNFFESLSLCSQFAATLCRAVRAAIDISQSTVRAKGHTQGVGCSPRPCNWIVQLHARNRLWRISKGRLTDSVPPLEAIDEPARGKCGSPRPPPRSRPHPRARP